MRKLILYLAVFITLNYGFCWPTIINIPADYPTIQQGIDASTDGDTVLVQPGTYVENINFNGHNIVLASLFLTTEDTSYISQTIIDGDSSGTVVIFESGEDSTAVITGLTIQNGLALSVGGLGAGGGIICGYSNPVISHNIITGNHHLSYPGAGIVCASADPLITNNLIVNNYCRGIICRDFSSPKIIQNTICFNYKGIACYQSNPEILNTIIWYNSDEIWTTMSSPQVTYCAVREGWPGVGNLNNYPMFLNPYGSDFNICSQSPCIDSGDPVIMDPDGTRSDIGVFFADHPLCSFGNFWYVSATGNDTTGDGSLNNPFRTIQHAVDISFLEDTVFVQPGIYNENILIGAKNLTLASNYIFSSDTLDIINTSIVGDTSAGTIINMRNCDNLSQITGFRFTDGNELGSGAIGVVKCDSTLINNNIFDSFDYGTGTVVGSSRNFNVNIIDNIFRFNNSNSSTILVNCNDRGGGTLLKNNIFHDNSNSIILLADAGLTVERNNIFNNDGLVFWCFMANLTIIRNNLIYNNYCPWGGGIFHTQDSGILAEGNTICNNTGSYDSYLGFLGDDHVARPVDIIDNIIWGNSYENPESTLFWQQGYDPTITYSDVQGGWPGEGNIECDPQFCDPDSGNFYLHFNSCCVGAGQNGENMGVYGIGCWSACGDYVVGDVNGSGGYDGLDITYGVAYLKGGPAPTYECECTIGNILYPAGDVNNSCSYNGLDITYGVAYFKGGSDPIPCEDCPPVLDRIRR